MAGSSDGASGTCTLFGPPERISAAGGSAASSAAVTRCGTISLYTFNSRTRRAMSWAYCAPKSTTSTVSLRCTIAVDGRGWAVSGHVCIGDVGDRSCSCDDGGGVPLVANLCGCDGVGDDGSSAGCGRLAGVGHHSSPYYP